MKLIDNQQTLFFDELKQYLKEGNNIYICSTYFSVQALYVFLDELTKGGTLKILLDGHPEAEPRLSYDEIEWNIYHDMHSKLKADKVQSLIEEKAEIRQGNLGGQRFILIQQDDKTHCFSIVPQDLNMVALGLIPSTQPVLITSHEDVGNQYLNVFNQYWNNSKRDIKEQVLSQVRKAAVDYSPDTLYKYTLFNIFQNAIIDEVSEQRMNKIGFKDTTVWKMLYNFQQDAVLGAIDKIETFGGCIIADSVGLGKTYEALAIMKYYQMRNDRILVLCPKKLRDNWLIYSQNDIRNILAKDRFNFDVLNHTDLSRTTGQSGFINLQTINWGNYDLIVIDESHNFRNNPPKREGITRYQQLMNDIIKAGVKTKVLMLSATPVNTRMNDIKNQIAFITEQNDKALEAHGISSIDQTLRKAQQRFNSWLKDSNGRDNSRDILIESLDGPYFRILDLLTIARSRKHIQKYYDVKDIGKFPERVKPISRHADFDRNKAFPDIETVNSELNALNLKFYSPLSYVRADKKEAYEAKYDITTSTGSIFKQVERERSLIHLMRVKLLKRLESSIHSFRRTLESLLRQINYLLEKVEGAQSNSNFYDDLDINDIDFDDELLEDLLVGGKIKVLLQDIDLIKCREELLDEKKRIEYLLSLTRVVDPSRDAKLHELKALIAEKIKSPLNDGNRKVIVFSAFADTVMYLYDELHIWIKEQLGLSSAQVTGGDSNRTNLAGCKSDLSSILINFSPISKRREIVFPDAIDEIDMKGIDDEMGYRGQLDAEKIFS